MLWRRRGCDRDDINRAETKPINAELWYFYCLLRIINFIIRWWRLRETQPTAHAREVINAHRILVEKPERKKLVTRLWCTWQDNIKMDIR